VEQYERMIIDFVVIMCAPTLGGLVLALLVVALAAAVARVVVPDVRLFTLGVRALRETVVARRVHTPRRARAPSGWSPFIHA
jgi:hypothetical protein